MRSGGVGGQSPLAMQRPAVALLFISVITFTSLILLAHKLTHVGENEFNNDISTIRIVSDTRKLSALEEDPGVAFKEPVKVIYKNETDNSAHVRSSVEEYHELKEMEDSEQKENAREHQNLSNQVSTELNDTVLTLEHQHQKAKSLASSASEEQLKLGSRKSKQIRIKWQNNWKISQDARVRQIRDQVIRAKVYINLALAHNNVHIIRDLRQRVRDLQRALGDACKDTDLSKRAPERMRAMDHTLSRANQLYGDCYIMIKKLRAVMHSTEEQFLVHKKQTAFLTRLAARSFPKGLHCLPMRLTNEYYALSPRDQEFSNKGKLEYPSLYHYAIFSDNILGTAVVVNSTIFHVKEPEKHVFHIVTDKLNYVAMRMWFLTNPPGNATIEVQNIDEFKWLNSSNCPVLEQLESSIGSYGGHLNLNNQNPKYLTMLNHLRFYLPEVFPKLSKILFLDDDIVVQKDLTSLWEIDLHGKVNGAVEICGETFHRLNKYLNFSNPLILRNFDPNSCGWAYGMNIFDLEAWRKLDITGIYHKWQKLNKGGQLWKLGSLPPGLVTFYNFTCALDKSWHVVGLGYNPSISRTEIARGAVLHYNGNLKPWLEIGIARYKEYWTKYVNYDHIFLQQCNIGE